MDDLCPILKTICPPDGAEWDVPPVPWIEPQDRALRDLRFAWSTDFSGVPVTAETRTSIERLAGELARLGCKVEQRNPAGFDFDAAWENWGEIALAERAATGGERAAERVAALNATLGEAWAVARGSARGVRASIADYAVFLTRRDALITAFEKFFDDWDALLCPVTVSPAIPHVPFGTPIDVDGKPVPYFIAGTAYTSPFNLTGSPVVVLPLARSKAGLPIGVQVVGKRWSEPALLNLSKSLVSITGAFTPPPGFR